MTLDAATRRNLELIETLSGETKGSLLGVVDQTVTPMGKRLLGQWVSQPLLDIMRIQARQEGLSTFFSQSMLRVELRSSLKPLADLERLVNRILSGLPTRDLATLYRKPFFAYRQSFNYLHLSSFQIANKIIETLV